MKRDPLMKLYEKTDPESLAALAIGATLRHEYEELERILSVVPRKSYICPDVRYLNRTRSLMDITLLWGMLYWQAWSRELLLSREIIISGKSMDVKLLLIADAGVKHYQSLMRVLDAALNQFCQSTGLNAGAVRAWTEVPESEPQELSDEELGAARELVGEWLGIAGVERRGAR